MTQFVEVIVVYVDPDMHPARGIISGGDANGIYVQAPGTHPIYIDWPSILSVTKVA